MIDEAIEILKKHNYLAKVQQNNGLSCTLFLPSEDEGVKYEIDDEYIMINSEKWYCPRYTARLLILSDIMRRMKNIKLLFTTLEIYDMDGEKRDNLFEVLQDPDDEKENILLEIFGNGIENHFAKIYDRIAEKKNVDNGYRLLKSMF